MSDATVPDLSCGCDRPGDCPRCRLIDLDQAAAVAGVGSRNTIRSWVRRDHLRPVGYVGRSPRFLEWDVLQAELATRRRLEAQHRAA